jgi:hypothetical protein
MKRGTISQEIEQGALWFEGRGETGGARRNQGDRKGSSPQMLGLRFWPGRWRKELHLREILEGKSEEKGAVLAPECLFHPWFSCSCSHLSNDRCIRKEHPVSQSQNWRPDLHHAVGL